MDYGGASIRNENRNLVPEHQVPRPELLMFRKVSVFLVVFVKGDPFCRFQSSLARISREEL